LAVVVFFLLREITGNRTWTRIIWLARKQSTQLVDAVVEYAPNLEIKTASPNPTKEKQ